MIAEKMELCWKAPMDGFVNINWDATVDKTKKKMCISIIIKDSKCEVLVHFAEPKDHIIVSNVAEVMAALRGVNFICELRFYKIILEGGALQIVQALGKGSAFQIQDYY
jgi:hypothetical protein